MIELTLPNWNLFTKCLSISTITRWTNASFVFTITNSTRMTQLTIPVATPLSISIITRHLHVPVYRSHSAFRILQPPPHVGSKACDDVVSSLPTLSGLQTDTPSPVKPALQ
uniref:Uncharacterized protein n=1 Tax=Schistosoma curassoni TaxID=6186 RepID=A0A183KWR3_9TREM